MTTKANLDHMFESFTKLAPTPDGHHWALESNSPGDGKTRYCLYLVANGGGACFTPYGELYALGRSAAYDMLRALTIGLRMGRFAERFPNATDLYTLPNA